MWPDNNNLSACGGMVNAYIRWIVTIEKKGS